MSGAGASCEAYRGARARLVAWVRRSLSASKEWSPTPLEQELRDLRSQLVALADRAEFGPAWSELEEAHGEAFAEGTQAPAAVIKTALQGLRELAESARAAADRLPDPRRRSAVDHAALLFVHLHRMYGFDRPALSNKSAAVADFQSLLAEAGRPLSPERARGLLTTALRQLDLDPTAIPPEIFDLT